MSNAATSTTPPARDTGAAPRQASIVTGFTLEAALWLLIGVGSLILRLWSLGIAPLTNSEAANALSALALSRGENISAHDPVFTMLQSAAMSLFSAGDFSARLPVAIAGVLLCLAPALLRMQIGRQRALLFGGLLTLSPTLIFASRQAEGALLGWVLAFTAWCCWQRGWNRAALILTGLLLACGVDGVSPLIVLLAIVLVDTIAKKSRKLPVTGADLLLGGAAFLIASTGFFWHLSGLGDAFNGIALWPVNLGLAATISFSRLVIGSLVYEPFLILFAICGIALLLLSRQFQAREVAWLLWVIVGLVLLGVNNSRNAAGLAPLVIGSAALACVTLSPLLESPANQSSDEYDTYPRFAEGMVFLLSTLMLIYAFLGLSMYSAQRLNSWLFTILLGLMMVAGIGVVATLAYNAMVALRGIGLAVCLSLLLYTFSSGYALTQTRAADPAEAYIAEAGAEGLRDLVQTIQTTSARAYGDPNSIPIQVLDAAPPALRWALRDQHEITYVARLENAPAALTPINKKPDGQSAYIGSAFRITASASLHNIRCSAGSAGDQPDCTSLARWLTQRSIDERVITRWIFWLRSDTAQKANGQ